MDYQEAIYCMKVMADEEVCEDCNYYQLCDHTKQADMARIAISAMQELQALHEQGISLERLKDIDFRKQVVEHINYMEYMDIKDELEEYKQLGTLEEVREAAKRQKTKVGEWIPCTKRLPKDSEEFVLVQVSGKPQKNITMLDALCLAQYSEDAGWILELYPEWKAPDVIAWMPLPEPYKPDISNKQTNAYWIRSMTDEELADFIEMKQFFAIARNGTDGEEYTLQWLQEEVEE